MKNLPSLEIVKNQVWYDDQTGIFRARYGYLHHKAWRIIGRKESKGYLQINIDGRLYMAHRLAWLYQTGQDPTSFEMQIDHADNNKTNNAFSNLRLVTNKQNCENRQLHIKNKTGHRGVYKKGNLFIAELCHNYQKIRLGSFKELEDACKAVTLKRQELFTHSNEVTT